MDTTHGHQEPSVPAGEFKQRCLALLDKVAESGVSFVVTKRGRPVARVVPISPPGGVMTGSLQVLTKDEEALYSTGDSWEADPGG